MSPMLDAKLEKNGWDITSLRRGRRVGHLHHVLNVSARVGRLVFTLVILITGHWHLTDLDKAEASVLLDLELDQFFKLVPVAFTLGRHVLLGWFELNACHNGEPSPLLHGDG